MTRIARRTKALTTSMTTTAMTLHVFVSRHSCLVSGHKLRTVVTLFNIAVGADETPTLQECGVGVRAKVSNELALWQRLRAKVTFDVVDGPRGRCCRRSAARQQRSPYAEALQVTVRVHSENNPVTFLRTRQKLIANSGNNPRFYPKIGPKLISRLKLKLSQNNFVLWQH